MTTAGTFVSQRIASITARRSAEDLLWLNEHFRPAPDPAEWEQLVEEVRAS